MSVMRAVHMETTVHPQKMVNKPKLGHHIGKEQDEIYPWSPKM